MIKRSLIALHFLVSCRLSQLWVALGCRLQVLVLVLLILLILQQKVTLPLLVTPFWLRVTLELFPSLLP